MVKRDRYATCMWRSLATSVTSVLSFHPYKRPSIPTQACTAGVFTSKTSCSALQFYFILFEAGSFYSRGCSRTHYTDQAVLRSVCLYLSSAWNADRGHHTLLHSKILRLSRTESES